jgi:hypothetical protein
MPPRRRAPRRRQPKSTSWCSQTTAKAPSARGPSRPRPAVRAWRRRPSHAGVPRSRARPLAAARLHLVEFGEAGAMRASTGRCAASGRRTRGWCPRRGARCCRGRARPARARRPWCPQRVLSDPSGPLRTHPRRDLEPPAQLGRRLAGEGHRHVLDLPGAGGVPAAMRRARLRAARTAPADEDVAAELRSMRSRVLVFRTGAADRRRVPGVMLRFVAITLPGESGVEAMVQVRPSAPHRPTAGARTLHGSRTCRLFLLGRVREGPGGDDPASRRASANSLPAGRQSRRLPQPRPVGNQ